jgi:hypothetical protein
MVGNPKSIASRETKLDPMMASDTFVSSRIALREDLMKFYG